MSGESVRAGVVVTGTEVLTGRISDRNGPWIAERLGELGVEVSHIVCVGDRGPDLRGALRFLADLGVQLIVTSGGLGPTADDLTAEVVAEFAGRDLVLDEEMEERIAEILAGFARRMRFDAEALREANRKQALIPDGATPIDPAGTAPGLVVPTDGPTVIVLPGPPRELQAMWPKALATDDARKALADATPIHTETLRIFGIPESELAKALRDIEGEVDLAPLEITTCLRRAELEIDVRYRDGAEVVARQLMDRLAERFSRFVFSRDGSSIDEQVAGLLAGKRIGLGESCTAGLMAARLTERPGSSAYVAGGVVAYSNEAKQELLDVPAELIEGHGAVSPEVAEAMADGALARFHADLGVGITGIAGPDGGSEEKPVGYVCICVKRSDGEILARDPVLPGDRAEIRDRSTTVAMHLLRRLLRGEEFPL
ncbi:MAG TPA: competence/damage-inducible protein A [Solirubrobacterales bacterium]|nr:competence/damage-inducible protein A [Solirubrobacterales bacterium]